MASVMCFKSKMYLCGRRLCFRVVTPLVETELLTQYFGSNEMFPYYIHISVIMICGNQIVTGDNKNVAFAQIPASCSSERLSVVSALRNQREQIEYSLSLSLFDGLSLSLSVS